MKYIKKVKQLPLEDTYFIISDLHLGTGDASDKFLHTQDIVFYLLNKCVYSNVHVIILGDLFEMALNNDIEAIKNQHDDIMWTLEMLDKDNRLTYVRGNHDAYVKQSDIELRTHQYDGSIVPLITSSIYDAVEIGDYLLLHGHQVYWKYRSWFNHVMNGLLRHVVYPLQKWILNYNEKDVNSRLKEEETDRRLLALGEQENKIIIAGHSHKCKVIPGYFNIGAAGILPRTVTYGYLNKGRMQIRKCRKEINTKTSVVELVDTKINFTSF